LIITDIDVSTILSLPEFKDRARAAMSQMASEYVGVIRA
jgi:hypothetical protein